MTEAAGGRRYYNCLWAQEDVEILYNLLNNNNNNNNNLNTIKKTVRFQKTGRFFEHLREYQFFRKRLHQMIVTFL
jgi:hypothetical protein